MRFVSAVTRSASIASSVRRASSSVPGETRRKIAAIGSRRKSSATLVARTSVVLKTSYLAAGMGRNPALRSTA